MRTILMLVSILLISIAAHAASASSPAYRHVVLEAGYPWSEGLTARFAPDEQMCRRMYGSQWQTRCAASFGAWGQAARGVKMTPVARGRWEWRGESVVFVPADEHSIRPNTAYHVDLSNLYLPPSVKADALKVSCRTPHLAAALREIKFMLDPSPAGQHRLFAEVAFNYPVEDRDWLPKLEIPASARAGKPEAVWSSQRDSLAISWPITRLPEKEALARLNFGHMGQAVNRDGRTFIYPSPDRELVFSQNLPARDGIFNIEAMELAQRTDANLNKEYVLRLRSSLQARPEDALANMFVLELPEFMSKEAVVPYDWSSAPSIPLSVRERSRVLKPVPLQKDGQPATVFEFVVPVASGRHIMVGLKPDFASTGGIKLRSPWFGTTHAKKLQAGVDFMHNGSILPSGGELALYGNDLDAIQWQARLVDKAFMSMIGLASSQPFATPLDKLEGTGIGMESMGQTIQGEIPLQQLAPGQAQFASLDLASALEKARGSSSGLALVTINGMKNGQKKASASRLILTTDLGLVIKSGADGSIDCFARLLEGKKQASGALVSILGANGKPVAQARTDNDGRVSFPSLKGMAKEANPVVIVAEHGGNLAWLPLRDKSRELNYSAFDVGGRHVAAGDTLVYLFNQRDLYRPGDRLYFGCMIKKGDFSPFPADVPLYAELLNPLGQKIWESAFRTAPDGLNELSCAPDASSLTGKYTLNVRTGKKGDVLGTVSARIEEFQPDLLRMKVSPPQAKGWLVADEAAWVNVGLQNLYGTPAVDHRIAASYSTSPAIFSFPAFGEYVFADPAPFIGSGTDGKLGEQQTDANGGAVFELPKTLGKAASARVSLAAQGFEKSGGRACGAWSSFLVSPVKALLGWKPLGAMTNPSFVIQGAEARARFVAIDNRLEQTAFPDLRFSLARAGRITNLVSDGAGGYRLDEVPQETVIKSWNGSVGQDGLEVSLQTDEPGDYVLSAADKTGRVFARLPYSVVGERLASAGASPAPSKMRMKLEKNDYSAGDIVNIAYSLPYDATGLISIEREGVLAYKWVDGHAGDNLAEIGIPGDFEGKGHITATFMREPSAGAPFMNPLAWAAEPFTANIRARNMGLELVAPKDAQPGAELEVSLTSDKAGKAVIFAVDEGILQLSGFADPDPLKALLADRALDVKTLQTADLLLPLTGRPHKRNAAFGGGADSGSFSKQFQNPFKRRNEPPVVYWSGLVDAGEHAATVKIPVPSWYAGSLRIMAAGSGASAVGSASIQTIIKAPLALTPVLPLAVAPGDKFRGSFILANTTDGQMRINPELPSVSCLQVNKSWPESLSLESGQEKILSFDAIAADAPGECSVALKARYGDETGSRAGSISIRPASSLRATLQTGVLEESGALPKSREVYAQFAKSEVTLSGLPASLAYNLASYLETYPYGCTEQLLSRALSHAALLGWPGRKADTKATERLFEATAMALRSRSSGQGVSLWQGGEPNLLLTAYAVDYLLLLRERNIAAHDDLLKTLCDSLAWNCELNEPTLQAARASAYAIWVLAREGRVVTQLLENLAANMREKGIAGWQTDLAGLLIAAARREMHSPVDFNFASLRIEPQGWFDEYAQQALAMTIRSRYYPETLAAATDDFIRASIGVINNSMYSTFSSAMGIRALTALGRDKSPLLQAAAIECTQGAAGEYELGGNGSFLISRAQVCPQYKVQLPPNAGKIFWQVSTSGYDRVLPEKPVQAGMEITREYLDEDGRKIMEAMQGDIVTVRVSVRGELPRIEDVAIVDILPGGLEMIMPQHDNAWPDGVKARDRREDRMLVFADLENGQLVMTWKARAVTPGEYIAPAASAQAMYQPQVNGATAAGLFTIKAR